MTPLKAIPKRVMITRVAMCGGGLAYDVMVPVAHVDHYEPCRYTTVWRDNGKFVRLEDAMTSEEHFAMEKGWDRYDDKKAIDTAVASIAYRLAVSVFPELAKVGKIPMLWACGLLPVETHSDIMINAEGKIVAQWRYEDGKAVKCEVSRVN